jgi:hypothetical protein
MAINRTWRDWQDDGESQDSKPNIPSDEGEPGNSMDGPANKTQEASQQSNIVNFYTGTNSQGIPTSPLPPVNMDMEIKPITSFHEDVGGFTRESLSWRDEHWDMNRRMRLDEGVAEWELNKDTTDPAFIIKHIKKKRLNNAIANVFAKIAEDLTGEPVPGDDEWYMEDLLYRSCTRKPINKCKVDYEKERLVLVLDNSPSCSRQATFFSGIATAALKLNDVEIYAAPNARMTAWMNPKTSRYEDLPLEDTCDYISHHADIYSMEWRLGHWMRWKSRVVVFFGDADGIEVLCNASRHVRKLYWFNCLDPSYGLDDEDIYDVELYLHNSLGSDRTDAMPWSEAFIGKMYQCQDEDDFMDLIRKVRI